MTDNLEKLTAEDGKSLDLEAQNIEQLKQLFPDIFREDKVDFDALKALLGEHVDDNQERYNFTWHGKNKARQIAQTASTGTLRPCIDESVNWDSAQNLFIEGDNLEVLKLLQKSYHQKVDVIFIDPPYNTGKDFIYPDNFRGELKDYLKFTKQVDKDGNKLSINTDSSGRYHTEWLNMMYPRMKLARNLLSENGVIFISIDDVEVANLRMLCNEVFGEDNFINNIVWQKKYTRANDAKWFSDNHDHILVFAKNKNNFRVNLLPRNSEQLAAYKNPDNHPKGIWKATPLHAKSGTNTATYKFKNGIEWTPPTGTFRRYNDKTMQDMEDNNEIWFGERGDQTPNRKSFLCDVKDGVTPVTIWPYDEVGHNHEATSELKELGLGGLFNNPKPTRLIERIIQLGENENKQSIILDFFAGSGTTAHAVLKKNAEDGGKRRFITIQLPEPCEKNTAAFKAGYKKISDITKQRLKNVLAKQNNEGGFRAFKLDETNFQIWSGEHDDLINSLDEFIDGIKSDRESQDLLFEIILKYGLDLNIDISKIAEELQLSFSVGYGSLIFCFEPAIDDSIVHKLIEFIKESDSPYTRVVFKDSSFKDDKTKMNALQYLKQAGVEDVKSV
ncbi:MAG: site-specific DNA-methyltransferase [Pseudomonadota bacterium]|nr:site-specific DNA-methyltransferase [Pseudomonadota bacterium]